jgi:ABC-type multidrug transport system ATPase subunit
MPSSKSDNPLHQTVEPASHSTIGGDDARFAPCDIELRNVKYSAGKGKKRQEILRGITATFSHGENVAVIGPRKSGKSTLLNVISGNVKGSSDGEILFNGSIVPKGFHTMYFLLPKDQVLYPGLTPRQTLLYSAQLRLPDMTATRRSVIVSEMLVELHLSECADKRIGKVGNPGISRGERKRTCIANELIMNPSV